MRRVPLSSELYTAIVYGVPHSPLISADIDPLSKQYVAILSILNSSITKGAGGPVNNISVIVSPQSSSSKTEIEYVPSIKFSNTPVSESNVIVSLNKLYM